MDPILPALAGHKGLRGDVLLALKRSQPLSAGALGEGFGVSANAVRRHLKELEVEGLVAYSRDQKGTAGAPSFSYHLTDAGEALFPHRYEDALTRLLNYVMEHEGRGAAASVLGGQYADMRRAVVGDLDTLSSLDRVKEAARVMEEAGFMAEYQESDGEIRLRINNCVIHAAASCLPEVCETELRFLQDVMNKRVERRSHIMDGCNACEYVVKDSTPPAA